jgi:spermidine synthase
MNRASPLRVVPTARGVSLRHGRHVVSEVLRAPGPTHSVFDVLAALVALCAPGPRVAMLGFAGGGMVAPLRALGCRAGIHAVDLEASGERIFRSVAGPWCGRVSFAHAEASAWLRARPAGWDAIVDDLSAQVPGEVVKPDVSLDVLPGLMASRLARGGVVVINGLPCPGWSGRALVERLSAPHREARVVEFTEFVNRIVVAGRSLPDARFLSARLRAALESMGSRQARRVRVRTLRTA